MTVFIFLDLDFSGFFSLLSLSAVHLLVAQLSSMINETHYILCGRKKNKRTHGMMKKLMARICDQIVLRDLVVALTKSDPQVKFKY